MKKDLQKRTGFYMKNFGFAPSYQADCRQGRESPFCVTSKIKGSRRREDIFAFNKKRPTRFGSAYSLLAVIVLSGLST
ncbi:MAG: hypothetical protein KAQ79_06545 [Cyclobacteriaceae bacterium]|nr:hypothetical protein [Cyclobacteriaceae bacterium]